MSRRHASQEHASQKTAADGGEAEPRDGRRRFVLGVAGLASGAVAALVGPLAISACLAQAAEPNAACSSTQGEGTVAVAPASSSTDAEAGSAGPGGDAWSTASTFGFDPFAYMVNEVPMGQTAVLSNATDPNAAPDRSTRALGWEGAMEVTVNSATLYQGSFNVDEELGSLNLGYIAQGSPVSLTGGSYALEDWRFLVCEMQLRNVDAVTPLRAAVEEAEANPDLGIAVDSGSSTIDDFNIGSWYLLSSQSTLMSGEGWFDGSVATFSGTKDNPGLGEIYHFTIEPGETKTFLLGFWLPVDADLGDLWLMAAAGGQRPNGNFFKLDVTAASPQAAAGTSLEA